MDFEVGKKKKAKNIEHLPERLAGSRALQPPSNANEYGCHPIRYSEPEVPHEERLR